MSKHSLKVDKAKIDEVRNGWVRINENDRDYIEAGSLIGIKLNDKSVRRIVYGLIQQQDNKKPNDNFISLDEPTRISLGIKDDDIVKKEKFEFEINVLTSSCDKIFFYLDHPEPNLKFTAQIGLLSLLLGLLSLTISLYPTFYNNIEKITTFLYPHIIIFPLFVIILIFISLICYTIIKCLSRW
ncbi:MAG: hypothetical protein LBT10_09820 [Methanobrevibacter sp.]|jgi:hypothetical protein|nr:hypothetical protein [Methanobrevibacter sp.]